MTATTADDNNKPDAPTAQVDVGTRVCKRYDDSWYDGVVNSGPTVGSSTEGNYLVLFEDEEEDSLSPDEVEVGILAYEIVHTDTKLERPPTGTRIKKRFEEGWFYGAVISQSRDKSLVLYREDGDEEYLSDMELQVTAATYQKEQHRP